MSKFAAIALVALTALVICPTAQASLTGDPIGNSFGWTPNSTNALNYAKLVPGREGQLAPYVTFVSATSSSIELSFTNGYTGQAYFEYLIDGVGTTWTNNHPVVIGDSGYYGVNLPNGTAQKTHTFLNVTSTVDIRLALGGERDWDFDWVRFYTAPVPEPGTVIVWSVLGMCGLGVRRRHVA